MKKVLIGFVLLVVLAVGGIIGYTLYSLDGLVKDAIESYGSDMTGTRVRVGSVSIQLRDGKGTINRLRISNPKGFPDGDAFSLGQISLDLDPGSLTAEPVVIEEVVIREPIVNFAVNAQNQTNLKVISDNLNRYSPPAEAGGGGGDAPGDPSQELRMRVNQFVFEGAQVTADTTAIGGAVNEVEMPETRMKNVGGKNGASGAEIGQEILTSYTARILKMVAANNLDKLIDEKLGGQEGEAAKKLLNRFLR